MKCLLDMTVEDLECLHNSFNLDEWQIYDTPINKEPEYRTKKTINTRYSYLYDFLIDLASYKDIYKNEQPYLSAEEKNFNHDILNTEIISWIDSLKFLHTVLRYLPTEYRNETNIISEYCLFEPTNIKQIDTIKDIIPNVLSGKNTQYRADYIITYKNIILIIEVTEIPSNKYFKTYELIQDKKEQSIRYQNLLQNYLTKEQKEKIEIHKAVLHIHTHRQEIENDPGYYGYNNNTNYTITNQIEMFSNHLAKKLYIPNKDKTNTNYAYNILRTINNYIPPEINID